MHPDLEIRHRFLRRSYRRFLEADRAFQLAFESALGWFPRADAHGLLLTGDPGSRLRRLYDKRHRALSRLHFARAAFKQAKARLYRERTIRSSSWVIYQLSDHGS